MKKSTINNFLQKFGVEIHGVGFIQSLKKQSFKEDAFERQAHFLEQGKTQTIFDVGANRGDIVEKYLSYFPEAIIHAFEPFPGSFEILTGRYRDNARVKCFDLALADSAEPKTFYVNQNVDTNSLLKPTKSGLSSDAQVKNKDTITVNANKLDAFCREHGVSSIDILKMDIQGGELSALKGASSLLLEGRVKLLFLEVYFIPQYENHPLYHEVAAFLYQHGYVLQDFYNPIYGNGNFAWADAIFRRKGD